MGNEETLKFIEVEYKYRAGWINKEAFIKKCKGFKSYKSLSVYGPDTYYEASNGEIVRWRHSEELDELTNKSRTSKRSSLIRKEIDLTINKKEDKINSVKTILNFIHSMGLKRLFRIYKDCEIFWFKDKNGKRVSVVYYTVYAKNRPKRDFIEIEVEKDQSMSISEAKALVKVWEEKLGLKPAQRINGTLLELYSDKETKLLQEKEGKQYCYSCLKLLDLSKFYKETSGRLFNDCKTCTYEKQDTEEKRQYRLNYWHSTKEERAKVAKKYREKNKEKLKKLAREYNKRKRKEDIEFKLKCNLRSRLYLALTRSKKVGSAIKDLGCTLEELRKHIESGFYPHPETGEEMTWETWGMGYGKWQIDHVKPLAQFKLADRAQFQEAVHYKNLQPLWYVDHLEKTKEDLNE